MKLVYFQMHIQNFKTLYDQLIAQGSISLYEGLLVGVAIEELDIADLEDAISKCC